MTGAISTTSERQDAWTRWGRVVGVAGSIVWVCWGLFIAYFWIAKGFGGIPLGPQ